MKSHNGMRVNKGLMGAMVVMIAIVFSMVFIRQLKLTKDEIANSFNPDEYGSYAAPVAGSSVNRHRSDSPEQLDRELDSLNLSVDEQNAVIENQLSGF